MRPTGNQGDGVLATILGGLEGVGLEAGESCDAIISDY